MSEINTTLDSNLRGIELSVDKARTVLQDVTGNYFGRHDPEKDHFCIIHEFNRNGIYCDIVDDYLRVIERQVKDIREAME